MAVCVVPFLPYIETFSGCLRFDLADRAPLHQGVLGTLRLAERTVEDEIVCEQIAGDVRRMVELLPDEQREVVMMRYYSGLSFKEIAEQTGVSINTALGRMRYALINLRKMIKEKNLILS